MRCLTTDPVFIPGATTGQAFFTPMTHHVDHLPGTCDALLIGGWNSSGNPEDPQSGLDDFPGGVRRVSIDGHRTPFYSRKIPQASLTCSYPFINLNQWP